MLHRVLNPDYNIKLIVPLYPSWADRTPKNTPCHLLRYGPCATPKGPTGELLSGFPLLHDKMAPGISEWSKYDSWEPWRQAEFHPAWRLWESRLLMEPHHSIAAQMMNETGRFATPEEMGVPAELRDYCDMNATAAREAMDAAGLLQGGVEGGGAALLKRRAS